MSEIVKTFCERFCDRDSNNFIKLFIDDATYIDSLYGEYKGKDEIIKFHKRCHEEAKDYKFIPKNIISEDNKIAFEWELTFTLMTPFSKGEKITVEGCSFMTIRNGKIFLYKEYTDSIAILLKGKVPDNKIIKFYRKKYNII